MDSEGYGARLHIQMDTFSGTAALKWPTGCFEQVCRQNGFRIKGKVPLVFIRTFLLGSDRGTVLLYPSGTIIVIGAKSYELMIRIFHEGLIASLAQNSTALPIFILSDIRVSSCRARVHLNCGVDISKLKQFIANQLSYIGGSLKLGREYFNKNNSKITIPVQMHGISKVTVVITFQGHLEIYKANLVSNLPEFIIFLRYQLLRPYLIAGCEQKIDLIATQSQFSDQVSEERLCTSQLGQINQITPGAHKLRQNQPKKRTKLTSKSISEQKMISLASGNQKINNQELLHLSKRQVMPDCRHENFMLCQQ